MYYFLSACSSTSVKDNMIMSEPLSLNSEDKILFGLISGQKQTFDYNKPYTVTSVHYRDGKEINNLDIYNSNGKEQEPFESRFAFSSLYNDKHKILFNLFDNNSVLTNLFDVKYDSDNFVGYDAKTTEIKNKNTYVVSGVYVKDKTDKFNLKTLTQKEAILVLFKAK